MSEIRFDDLNALKAKIGAEFGPWSKEVVVTQEMINRFADVTGDHQWIHIDIERAKRESPFGGPVAHGFLTLSLLPQLGNDLGFQIVGNRAGINYGANKLRFVSPVPSGAKVYARSRLTAVDKRPLGTQLTMETNIHIVGNDKPCLIYEPIFVLVG